MGVEDHVRLCAEGESKEKVECELSMEWKVVNNDSE